MNGTLELGSFDLIYSAGLYDYLASPVAAALTSALTKLLTPGGKLLLGNFADGFATQAYMECFMDWRLVSRSEYEMRELFAIPADGISLGPVTTFADSGHYVFYATCMRIV